MKKNLLYLFVLIAIFSCNRSTESVYFGTPKDNTKDIKLTNLVVEKIQLDTTANVSFEGNAGVRNDNFYYFDYLFGFLYEFDTDGKLISRGLGRGHSKKEIDAIPLMHTFLNNGNLAFIGGSSDHHVYDKDLYQKDMFVYFKNRENATLDSIATYGLPIVPILRSYGNKIYANTNVKIQKYHFMMNQDSFLDNYRWIYDVNLDKKCWGDMYGKGFPNIYKADKSKVSNFIHGVNFDIDKKGNFYVNFEMDSLIYKYDKNFNYIEAFGWEGRDFNRDYATVRSVEEFRIRFKKQSDADRFTKGRYTWVEYIDELGYTCRSYQKDKDIPTDGLQIYSGTTMIADIDVPKGFKPIGYAKPYLFSEAITEKENENERLITYRIKME